MIETCSSPTPAPLKRRLEVSENPVTGPLLDPSRKQKRLRTSPSSLTVGDARSVEVANNSSKNWIDHWRREGRWPAELFIQNDQIGGDSYSDHEESGPHLAYWKETNMNHLLARRKSSSSMRGRQLDSHSTAPSSSSDQKPKEAKSSLYARPNYEIALAAKGSFMSKSKVDITDATKELCRTLLETEQSTPTDSLFRDDLFEQTCDSIRARNEAMVVRDISPLICPSAQVLRIYGGKHLYPLNESVNEGWNSAISYYGPRPQPDYSVGFGRAAFSDDQLQKLVPFVGEVTDTVTSFFLATWQLYFPFLACEVKCGAAALDVADRQNAHSMTLAVRGIVELFRLKNRAEELNREILAFSISHDHRTVRIYGHYPVIDGVKTTFYRHPIHTFDFTARDGKERWTAYKFTKNVYDIWMPSHLSRICSVIDSLPPDINFEVSQQSGQLESGLSQGLESQYLSDNSGHDTASLLEETGSQPSRVSSRDVTPDTSMSQRMGERAPKKLKKRGRPEELHQDVLDG
jgi:hypothetical protein